MKELQHARIVTNYDEAYGVQYGDDSHPRNALLSERFVLGAMLWHGPAVGSQLRPDDFYSVWHSDLFLLIHELYDLHPGHAYLDPIAVKDYMLLKKGLHSRFSTDMVFMYDEAISFSLGMHACGYHVDRVLDAAAARVTQQFGLRLAQSGDADRITEIRAEFQPALDSLRSRSGANSDDLLKTRIDEQVRLSQKRFLDGVPPAIPTGLSDLDQMLNGGYRPKTLNVIGARPGVGKTLMAGAIAVEVARTREHHVLYITMELSTEEITNRVLANVGSIDLTRLQNPGELTDQDWQQLHEAELEVADWPLHIEEGGRTIEQIEQTARAHLAGVDSGMLVVDFLQRIREDGKAQSRERAVAGWASRLTDLAKELQVPVLCIVSFSRESVRRGGTPRMDDIRDSGGVESDADTVVLMWVEDEKQPNTVDVVIPKNRYGSEGRLQLTKQGYRGRLVNAARNFTPHEGWTS